MECGSDGGGGWDAERRECKGQGDQEQESSDGSVACCEAGDSEECGDGGGEDEGGRAVRQCLPEHRRSPLISDCANPLHSTDVAAAAAESVGVHRVIHRLWGQLGRVSTGRLWWECVERRGRTLTCPANQRRRAYCSFRTIPSGLKADARRRRARALWALGICLAWILRRLLTRKRLGGVVKARS